MNMLDKMKNASNQAMPVLDQAFMVVNDTKLTFAQKLKQIEQLDKQSKGQEHELFGDVYSALYNIAKTEDDFKLISGSD